MNLKMNENCFVSLFSLQKCLPIHTGKEKTIRQLQEKHLHQQKKEERAIRKMQLKKKKKITHFYSV